MRIKIALIIAVLITLCGCGGDSVETSLKVPELPAEFIEFNDEISKIKNQGYDLVSPNGGTNRQAVQLTDLDGDGVDEGIAFFREAGNSYNVYIYVFKKMGDSYEVAAKMEGTGDTVENVTYADLLGNGNNELVVGWSMSDSGAKSVGVYSVADNDAVKLCEVNSIYHVVCDLNYDMVSDLCVVYVDPADGEQKLAMYSQKEGSVLFCASAPLSATSDNILRIRASYIEDLQPAIFVEKRYESSGIVTDVIVWNNTFLKNLTYSADNMESGKTARTYEMYAEDIDGDGALEIPMPQSLSVPYVTAEGTLLTGISWYGVGIGSYEKEMFAFRSSVDKWNMTLPLDWEGKCVAVYRKDASANVTVFYSHRENKPNEELFSLAVLTGENREKNLEKMGYEKIADNNGTIYGVKIKKTGYMGYDISAEMLAERFSCRQSEWSTGEVVF